MSWGYKILILYVVFVAGIMFLVIKSSNQKVDLVTPDYYDKELKYQQKINARSNVQLLTDSIKYGLSNGKMVIVFPKDFKGKKVSGNVVLYCPSDEKKDIKHNFLIQDEPISISIPGTKKLEYELQLTWRADNTDYYFEKKLILN